MDVLVLNGWAASVQAWELCKFPRRRIYSYIEQLDGAPGEELAKSDGAILVGWSMGGSSALRLAAEMPEKVAALVLVAATPRMMKDAGGWAGMTERRLAALQAGLRLTLGGGFFGPPQGCPNPYQMDCEENLSRGIEYLRATDLRGVLEEKREALSRIPAWIFQSERDAIVPAANAAYLKGIFPEARLEIVPGAEHALPVTIPEKIDAAVRSLAALPQLDSRAGA